ncbi:MAG: PC4/YdbC family ssDNA-binding protein [Clostridia bacterium]
MTDFKYEILERLGVLSQSNTGWTKELNLISWNDREGRYDIREWSPDRTKMSKGVSFSDEEIKKLKEFLKGVK